MNGRLGRKERSEVAGMRGGEVRGITRTALRPARSRGAAGGEAQFLQQRVGRGGEQHAELVRPERRTTGAVESDVEQFLDPVLDLAARAVDALVDPARLARQVGDDEARVEFRLTALEPDH